jgi:glycosyltransferase involved in cell wall biosynthesis
MAQRTRILILVRALEAGGAERQIVNLARHIDRERFELAIATFYDDIRLPSDLNVEGLTVFSLHKAGRWDMAGFLWRYGALLRRWRPDVVHGFMEVANLTALAGRLLAPAHRVVWGIRRSGMDAANYDWSRRLLYGLEAGLARFADLIVANSNAGRDDLIARGVAADRLTVVSNGIDVDRYSRSPEGRASFRAEIGVSDDTALIGMLARHDPKKDHATFVRAAARLHRQDHGVRFVLVGRPVGDSQARLQALAARLGVGGAVSFLDQRSDTDAVLSGFDIATLSSAYGEGFPNVLAEAMAVGTLVATTDTGDAARIAADIGEVVPPADPVALADAWARLLRLPADEARARTDAGVRHIREQFAVGRMVADMQDIYTRLVTGERRR